MASAVSITSAVPAVEKKGYEVAENSTEDQALIRKNETDVRMDLK